VSRAKYPDEVPVFEIDGGHWLMRPLGTALPFRAITVVTDTDSVFCLDSDDRAKPLTRAARELLRWSRK